MSWTDRIYSRDAGLWCSSEEHLSVRDPPTQPQVQLYHIVRTVSTSKSFTSSLSITENSESFLDLSLKREK